MTTANLQEEKKAQFSATKNVRKKPKSLPWWVYSYFQSKGLPPLLDSESVITFKSELMYYHIQLMGDCFVILGHIDPASQNPDDLVLVFQFPIPPTEEKFRTVMQVLDIQ